MGTVTDMRVKLNLAGPSYQILELDRKAFAAEGDEVLARARVTQLLLKNAVNAHFAQGMGGHDARVWSRLLPLLNEDEVVVEVSNSDLEWLWKIYSADTLKLPAVLSVWRMLLETYLLDMRDGLRKEKPV